MSLNDTIPTLEGDASFGAYVAKPSGAPRGAIIVIQEIFGVNPGIRQKCDKLAAEGYLAVAPDLFWRLQPAVSLDPDVESEFHAALDLMGKFNQDAGIRDIEATIHHIRRTHRFRWDAKLQAMRLIGLDATLYSRTFAHDGVEASWNLLTGDLVTRTLRLDTGPGDRAYNPVGEKKSKRPVPPLRLEDSFRPEGILPNPEPN